MKQPLLRSGSCSYVYINKAICENKCVVKIGVTVNLKKRLSEFNNGVRCRSKYFSNLKGVVFKMHASYVFTDRNRALDIEREFKERFSEKIAREFGVEVFKISTRTAEDTLKKLMA